MGQETYQLDTPPQERGFKVLVVGESAAAQDLDRIDDAHPTIEFTAGNVELEVLFVFRSHRDRQHPGAGKP